MTFGDGSFQSTGASGGMANIAQAFARSRGWLIFFAILCLVYTMLCVAGGCVAFFTMSNLPAEMPSFFRLMPILYVFVGVAAGTPGILLLRFQSALGDAVSAPSETSLLKIADRQHQLWKLSGLMVIAFVLIMMLFSVGIMIAGFSMVSEGVPPVYPSP